jgi:hypothetical protein
MRRPFLWLVALFLLLVPAACAAPVRTPLPGDTPTASPASGPPDTSQRPGAGNPGSPGTGGGGGAADASCPQGVRTGTVTLSETDQGRTVCVATGTSVEVFLHAKSTGQQWSKPVPDRTILRPAANGKGALQVGVTAGFYLAAEPGQARITAQLAPCRGPKAGPACDAVQLFEVTITVR